MLNLFSQPTSLCDGTTRRDILRAGGAGLLGLNLPQILQAEASGISPHRRAESVIFLFLFGGPSQLETFDMKPEASAEIRGPFQSIAARTPGLKISEHLPRTAQVSDKFCLLKTMSHTFNDHSGGGHYIQTGQRWQIPRGGGFSATPEDWPSMGSAVDYLSAQERGGGERPLPNYVVLPNSLGRLQNFAYRLVRPGEYAGWLGRGWDPITTAIEKKSSSDNPYWRDCTDEELTFQIEGLVSGQGLSMNRLNRRRSLLQQFQDQQRTLDNHTATDAYDRFQQRALALVTSEETRKALDIRQEPAALRDRYGRHLFGQSTLMARRLVEAGVRFCTVHYDCVDGYSWDSHRNSDSLKNHLLPTMDQAYSALLEDLEDRGLLDTTLVVCMGEMGRTPKPTRTWGRGHWSTLFPALLAGAGIQGGTIYGETDGDAAYPVSGVTSPEDLAATIYQALGISPHTRVHEPTGRPVEIAGNGRPVEGIFSGA